VFIGRNIAAKKTAIVRALGECAVNEDDVNR
jgi:hypothetical protein